MHMHMQKHGCRHTPSQLATNKHAQAQIALMVMMGGWMMVPCFSLSVTNGRVHAHEGTDWPTGNEDASPCGPMRGGSSERSRPRSSRERVKNRVDVPISPGRQAADRADRETAWTVPDVLDRRISRGMWALAGLSKPLGGRQCSLQTCISTTAWCPDPCVHRSCPWLVVMRLNLGDCTPEAQSAQHREWLPACCSWPSGCEEGAVSLVRIGEEQVGTHQLGTHQRQAPRRRDWASAGTGCTTRCGSCPVPAHPATLEPSPVPDARPASYYPHLPRPWVGPRVTNQPANLPTRL